MSSKQQELKMSKSFVRIVSGNYRKNDVSGKVFELVEQFKTGAKGGFVTVKNGGTFPGFADEIRINVTGPMDYQFVTDADSVAPVVEAEQAMNETDEQVIARIRERFDILDEMTKAATNGDIRAMIVSGPPGVGKSYGVEQIIEKATLFDQIAGKKLRAEVIKGSATALGLYSTLYKYSDPNCVVVFDDCDSILLDDVSLNLLKGALDSGKKRKISWLADSNLLRREGIPDSFNFQGSVIFITNLKFDAMKSQKLRDHLDALQSRCHYLDLTLDTQRDKLLRIKQIANDGALFQDMDLDQVAQDEIIAFMDINKNKLRELSLRMAIKVAQLRKSFPERWMQMARTTCMKA
jgi:ATPase family associated with various cellular activities (AAA)